MTLNSKDSIPEIMRPNWTGIKIENFSVKFGHIIKFESDSIELEAIVLDFSEDEDGQWVGVCFINDNQLFGRQIPNGMVSATCLDLLDLTYIQINTLVDYTIIDSLKLNKSKIGIGSRSPVTGFSEIKRDFERGIKQREKKQTPCEKKITDLNPVRECYFNIGEIKN